MKSRIVLPSALLAAALVLALCLNALMPDPYPLSRDAYYYALQADSLASLGRSLFEEADPMPAIVSAASAILGSTLVAVAWLGSLFAAMSAFAFFFLARELVLLGRSSLAGGLLGPEGSPSLGTRAIEALAPLAAALLAFLSSSQVYFHAEFLKNALAQAFFMGGLALGIAAVGKGSRSPLRDGRLWIGLALLAVATGVHRVYGALALAFVPPLAASFLERKAGKWAYAAVPAVWIGAYAAYAFLGGQRLDGGAPGLMRYVELLASTIAASEKAEHMIAAISLALWALPLVAAFRRGGRAERSVFLGMAGLHAACVLPLTGFGFDLASYRLMLLGVPCASALAAVLLGMASGDGRSTKRRAVLGCVAAAALAATVVSMALNAGPALAAKRPPYRLWARQFRDLRRALPPGYSVVAFRGLSAFLWYELGVPSENFKPDPGSPRKYARVIHGVQPADFPRGSGPGGAESREFGTYTLVDESAYRAAYESPANGGSRHGGKRGREAMEARPSDAPRPRYELFDLPFERRGR